MKQRCKYCGTEVTGEVASSAGTGTHRYPIGYRFTCNGVGDHGKDGEGREWFGMAPDPVGDYVAEEKKKLGL